MQKILIIDDDENTRDLFKIKFGSTYQVIEAENGRVGISLFNEFKPHIVVTDIFMPEEDGFSTILEIQKKNKKIPIIAITAMEHIGEVHLLDVAKEFGADEALLKPFDIKDVEHKIEYLTQKIVL